MRHRVTLQTAAESLSALGEPSLTWSAIATVWASIEPLRGREFILSQAESVSVDARIRIRYRSDVDTGDRVVWGSHTYDIHSVIRPLEKANYLELMVSEVT